MAAHPWGKEERSLTSSRSNHQLPNILMIITHDTGRHLGCYGRKVDTPNLDRLAGEGARFDSYFCPAPQCSPSRGSILTGRYP
ncbi:MAG TPA: sulfatase-like hydrolase/transferase, partial [Firmicutes bacterium]|nr:sulfatase-like hydrolase/transferase [Bacillota bacterium]